MLEYWGKVNETKAYTQFFGTYQIIIKGFKTKKKAYVKVKKSLY